MMTDAEFVEAMATRARRQYPEGVQVVDHELERLVALAREGLRWRELAAGDEREVIALHQRLADAESNIVEARALFQGMQARALDAEARVRELEEEQHEDRDAIRYIWLKTPGYIAHVWYPTHGRAINRAVGHSERNAVIDAARRTP